MQKSFKNDGWQKPKTVIWVKKITENIHKTCRLLALKSIAMEQATITGLLILSGLID